MKTIVEITDRLRDDATYLTEMVKRFVCYEEAFKSDRIVDALEIESDARTWNQAYIECIAGRRLSEGDMIEIDRNLQQAWVELEAAIRP